MHSVYILKTCLRIVEWGRGRGVFRLLLGNLRERDHLEEPGIDLRIILRWIFRKLDQGLRLHRTGSGKETGGGHL
jgi:hypothetical protein